MYSGGTRSPVATPKFSGAAEEPGAAGHATGRGQKQGYRTRQRDKTSGCSTPPAPDQTTVLYSSPLFIQHALASVRTLISHHLPSHLSLCDLCASASAARRACHQPGTVANLPSVSVRSVRSSPSVPDGTVSQLVVAVIRAGAGAGAEAVPVVRLQARRRGVRPRRQGALRRRHLRLRGRGVAGRGGDGVHGRAGDRERGAARRRHRGHLRRRLLHRGCRVVTRPLALGRLRRLDPPLHGGHHLRTPEWQAGPGEGGAGGSERRAESDQRHQLAVRGDERPVRDRQREGPPRGRGAPAAGDGDHGGGQRRRRGGPGAVLLGVPAGLPGGRPRAEAARLPPPLPRALHRLLACQARLLPAVPPRHLNLN